MGEIVLTDAKIRQVKLPAKGQTTLADEAGLYIIIRANGSKLWRYRFKFNGREVLMALGEYPDVSLQMARERHMEARRKRAADINPQEEKKAEKVTGATFRQVSDLWYESWKGNKSERYGDYVLRRMKDDVYPAIGDKPIQKVKATDLVALCKKIEARGANEIARRCKETCAMVFRWGVGHGYLERNPITEVRSSDVFKPTVKGHHARVEDKELPSVVAALMAHPGIVTRLASKLTMYTALRTANVINLEWAWVNHDAADIRYPAPVMKMRSDFICVLSEQAIAVLRAMKEVSGGGRFVFPGQKKGEALSNGAMLKALRDAGFGGKHTMHSFRAVFTTWAKENGYDRDVIETSLHHHKRGVSAHYDFAAYLPQRRVLAQAWSDHIDSMAAKAKQQVAVAAD
jgi:integrase